MPFRFLLRCGKGTDSREPWPLNLFPYLEGKTGLSGFEIFCLYVWNWTRPHLHCAASSLSHQEVIHLTGEGEIPALGLGNGWTKDTSALVIYIHMYSQPLMLQTLTAQGRKTLMHVKSQECCTWEQGEQPGAVGGRFLVSRGWGCKELSLVLCDDVEGGAGGHCEGSSRGKRYWYT